MGLIFPSLQGRGKPQPRARLLTGGINQRCVGAWLLGEGGGPQWADSGPQNRRLYIFGDNASGGFNEAAPWAKGRLSGLAYRTTGTSKTYLRTDRTYTPPTGNFSVNFWVYFIQFTDYYIQLDQWDETTNKRSWEVWTFGDGTIHASSSSDGSKFHREDGPALSLGRWYMITATFPNSGGTLKLYVNGAQVSTSGTGSESYAGIFNTAQPVWFGYSPGTAGTGFKGSNQKMEAVSIWERLLADDEIAGLYRDQFRQWERPRLTRTIGGVIVPPAYAYSKSPQAQRATYLRR